MPKILCHIDWVLYSDSNREGAGYPHYDIAIFSLVFRPSWIPYIASLVAASIRFDLIRFFVVPPTLLNSIRAFHQE